jgi:hypothetical protein
MSSIYVTGDIHGFTGEHHNRLSSSMFPAGKNMTKNDYLIIAGDFGLLWCREGHKYYKNQEYWINWLNDKPWTTLFVDGNHENFDMLSELPEVDLFGSKAGRLSDSIYHLKRGRMYDIDGCKILTLGGASSIDKDDRIEGASWWPGELWSSADIELALDTIASNDNMFDYIISHTAPDSVIKDLFLPHIGSTWYQEDPVSKFLEQVYRNVYFKMWYCGHMHRDVAFHDIEFLYTKIVRIK